MKRFLVDFILGVSAVCAGADEIADISNADLKIADNVRLELHRQMDTSALLKALQNEKRPEIRDGILYSLACMKCEQAFPILEKLAFEKLDECPAVILGLAKYDGTLPILQKLVANGSKVAKSALFMASPLPSQDKLRKLISESTDENEIVSAIYSLETCEKNIEFMLAYEGKTSRVLKAQCNVLSKFGGKKSAEKIFEISTKKNVYVAYPLGLCKDSTDVILDGIKAKKEFAVIASRIGRVSEAEDILYNQLFEKNSESYTKELKISLEVVANNYTALKLAQNFTKLDVKELPFYVKILTSALMRMDDSSKKQVVDILKEYAKIESPYQKAVLKILGK